MPSSNPTTGLGVAAYVQVSGTNITSPSGGTTVHPGAVASPINGQGIGATAGGVFPVAQYALSLSLSSAGSLHNTCQLTASVVDVQNNSESASAGFVYVSYNNPSAGSPSWYRPSPATSGNGAGNTAYTADIASVSSSGLITGLAVGQAIIGVQYPVFSNNLGQMNDFPSGNTNGSPNEVMGIYCQIIVTVEP